MMPNRIQRQRTKGWKKPQDAIAVSRGTKWGNPFKLIGDIIYVNAGYRRKMLDKWVYLCNGNIDGLIQLYESLFVDVPEIIESPVSNEYDYIFWKSHFSALNLNEIKGKDLMCFCKLDEKCHADILLKLANDK